MLAVYPPFRIDPGTGMPKPEHNRVFLKTDNGAPSPIRMGEGWGEGPFLMGVLPRCARRPRSIGKKLENPIGSSIIRPRASVAGRLGFLWFPLLMPQKLRNCSWLVFLLATMSFAHAGESVAELARPIRAVELEGTGNAEAARAWRLLVSNQAALPEVLAAMDGANDLAVNWLRAAAESIADDLLRGGGKLPVSELRLFLLETIHHPRGRRLAFELMARADPAAAADLVPGMLNDPSPELRRDAVQKLMDEAAQSLAQGNKPGAAQLYNRSLLASRDVDQVDGIATQLRALGQTVDLPQLFGFIMKWKVIGPFDSTGGKGFAAAFPPEQAIDLEGVYAGKSGQARWADLETSDEHGILSMNKPFGSRKGVAAYALARFYSDQSQTVQLRLGSQNAWKLWLNGKYLFGQEEYHRNKAIDQYVMQGQLQTGVNLILVKVCQNEQTDDWAGDWDFQLRICDALGTPIRSSSNQPTGDNR